jgi:hypothetical protein
VKLPFAEPGDGPLIEVELVTSPRLSCGFGGQAGLGTEAVYDVAALLDVL